MTSSYLRKKDKPTSALGRRLVAASAVLVTGAALYMSYTGTVPGWSAKDGRFSGQTSVSAQNAQLAASPYPSINLKSQAAIATGEQQKKVALLDALGNASVRFNAFSKATDQRIIDLHLENAFLPEALVSSTKLSESFQNISRLQDLQRRSLETKNAYLAELESAIRSSGLNPSTLDQQLALFKTSREESVKLDAELLKLENKTTQAAIAILNLAQRELGKAAVNAGGLVFQNPSLGEEYQRLMGELVSASTEQNKASVRLSELQQKRKIALEKGLQR